MRRRDLIAILGTAAAWPLAAAAQQGEKIYRVGFLWDSPSVWPLALEAFRQGLRDLGWVEGQNVAIEYRLAEGESNQLEELAKELVRLEVDVIVAPTSIYAGAAKRATSTIPIVFASHADPIGSGHVASLARPGGNLTGLTIVMSETTAKSLELLKEAVPGLSRVAALWDPATPSHRPGLEAVEAMGQALGLQLQPVAVHDETEFESVRDLRASEGRDPLREDGPHPGARHRPPGGHLPGRGSLCRCSGRAHPLRSAAPQAPCRARADVGDERTQAAALLQEALRRLGPVPVAMPTTGAKAATKPAPPARPRRHVRSA